jgi:hypothetical protein
MTQANDRLLQALGNLRSFTPDTEWEEGVRLRCHAKIAGRTLTPHGMRLFDVVTMTALFAYLADVLGQAARLLSICLLCAAR